MTAAEQLRSDVLDVLERLKLAHHALADNQDLAAFVHVDIALTQLADVRRRVVLPISTQRTLSAQTERTEATSVTPVPPPPTP